MSERPMLIPLSDMENSNPIVVGIEENPVMKRFEVVLQIGNFKDRHKAETVARHVVKLVEEELGSRAVKLQKSN